MVEYSYSDLRAMAYGAGGGKLLTEEAKCRLAVDEIMADFMNEAYYGRKSVAGMQKAISDIRDAYLENNNIQLNINHPLNKALQKAIEDAFGFKRCTVYWANSFDMHMGPFTVPQSRMFREDGTPYIHIGSNPNGFYDKDHKMVAVISSDLVLFDEPYGMTADEMTAVFLHEIGHNFDFTIFGIIKSWMLVYDLIVGALNKMSKGDVAGAAQDAFVSGLRIVLKDTYPELFVGIINIKDIAINLIPPIGMLVRLVGKAARPFLRLWDVIRYQTMWFTIVPFFVMTMPIRFLSNFFLRKSETFADSFAAAYGYGPEQVSALNKIDYFAGATSLPLGPVATVFNNLNMLQGEILTTLMQGHGSTQQRALRMLDSLNQSLNAANLSPTDRAMIEKERDRLVATYQDYISMDPEKKELALGMFRQMVDAWYGGKSYVIPQLPGKLFNKYAD